MEPKAGLNIALQARDAESARALDTLATRALKLLAQSLGQVPDVKNHAADLPKTLAQIKFRVDNDRLTSDVDLDQFAALLHQPLNAARAAAVRAQCKNNLKQIMLAMHNYLDSEPAKTFPPAYSVDKAGKPLLSWRVLILPYLAQNELYREFHHDEPWDSPHNKALIPRMPTAYRCPDADPNVPAGKTTYVTPRGKSTMFPGGTGLKIKDITDGTSNTIAVIDAGVDNAVIWTAPDDLDVEAGLKPETILKRHNGNGSNAGFADGSVRFISTRVEPDTLRKLITPKGGEVIRSNDE